MRAWYGWLSIGVMTGCVGQAPPLPEPMGLPGTESSGAGIAGTGSTTDGLEHEFMDSTGPSGQCGNGAVEPGEECDGSDLNAQTCMSLGFDGGRLMCNEDCRFADSECLYICGDGEIDPGEECDGVDLDAQTCASLGYSGRGLSCAGCRFDASECGPTPGMVEVTEGLFTMGSMVGSSDEQPERDVHLDRFWIDATEVTVSAYRECVDAEACSEPDNGIYCNWEIDGHANHPINCVDWHQAEEYCNWIDEGTKRLPTEAEWEKAARGEKHNNNDDREFPWGNSPPPSCSLVVMNDGSKRCPESTTMEVGSKPLGNSPYGAKDMSGNVWEWVSDFYGNYDSEETNNPQGPKEGENRVLRGGSWINSSQNNFRVAHRDSSAPAITTPHVGFRCASTPPAAPRTH